MEIDCVETIVFVPPYSIIIGCLLLLILAIVWIPVFKQLLWRWEEYKKNRKKEWKKDG